MAELQAKRKDNAVNQALNELTNSPDIVSYKDDDGSIKEVKVKRLKFICIEKAVQQFVRLVSIVKTGETGNKIELKNLLGVFNKEEMDSLKEIILTCLNITKDEFDNLPCSTVLNIINTWIVINEDEVNAMYKHFLAIKESVAKVQKNLTTLSA